MIQIECCTHTEQLLRKLEMGWEDVREEQFQTLYNSIVSHEKEGFPRSREEKENNSQVHIILYTWESTSYLVH